MPDGTGVGNGAVPKTNRVPSRAKRGVASSLGAKPCARPGLEASAILRAEPALSADRSTS
ncbi:MAG: hypothetical protein IAI50_04995 [Candidatus Eremiobacteraeota bacterium]|nr:hypothetical protein [Candidatus Eremiobacteraeota bacterium]